MTAEPHDDYVRSLSDKLQAYQELIAVLRRERERLKEEATKSGGPEENAALRERAAHAEKQHADEVLKRSRLLRICDSIGIPVPDDDVPAVNYVSDDYLAQITAIIAKRRQGVQNGDTINAVPEPSRVDVPSEKGVDDLLKDSAEKGTQSFQESKEERLKGADARALECLRMLSGSSQFEPVPDSSRFQVTIFNPRDKRKLSFTIGWDAEYMDYSPISVDLPEEKLPSFAKDSIDFTLDQAPVFFSQLLSAVFGPKRSPDSAS